MSFRFTGRTEKWTHFGATTPQEATPPYLAKWRYFRAPSGFVMELLGINISMQVAKNKAHGIVQIHQAHKPPSIYGIYPNIEDQDVIFRFEGGNALTGASSYGGTFDLYNYELKEFTVTYRSTHSENEFRPCIVIYYRYKPFVDNLDKLEYAVKQPRIKRSKGLGQLEVDSR